MLILQIVIIDDEDEADFTIHTSVKNNFSFGSIAPNMASLVPMLSQIQQDLSPEKGKSPSKSPHTGFIVNHGFQIYAEKS